MVSIFLLSKVSAPVCSFTHPPVFVPSSPTFFFVSDSPSFLSYFCLHTKTHLSPYPFIFFFSTSLCSFRDSFLSFSMSGSFSVRFSFLLLACFVVVVFVCCLLSLSPLFDYSVFAF